MAAHDEFDDFFDDDDSTPQVDTRADGRLLRVPLNRLAPNKVNPRTDFGTEDDLVDFGKSLARRQNQPCPVVSRATYLKLWPDHKDDIGRVDYVLVSGERRYRGATAVGLPALNCVVDDNFATSRKAFMEAVVSENVDRQNFDPVEEAYAVQALVAEFGSNRAVAQHFERADGWVTQRILLTNLAREIQDLVRVKTIPLEAARTLGKLARDKDWSARDQMQWWEGEQERRAAASTARAEARKAVRQQDPVPAPQPVPPAVVLVGDRPESFTAVKQEPVPAPAEPDSAAALATQVSDPPPVAQPPVVAQPVVPQQPAEVRPVACPPVVQPETGRQDPGAAAMVGRRIDYERPGEIALLLDTNMKEDHFFTLVRFLGQKAFKRDPVRYAELVQALLEQEPANTD